MLAKLEKLLELLSDDVWHDASEVAKALEIQEENSKQIIELLVQADMIQHNPASNQIKLNQNWKTIIINQKESNSENQTHVKTETTAIGTIIIPPQKTLLIQCTRITNLTNSSIELEVRMNKKLKEIAINKIE